MDFLEALPVSSWHTFSPEVRLKKTDADSTDDAEKKRRLEDAREALVSARVDRLRNKDSDDEADTKSRTPFQSANFGTNSTTDHSDDLGLRRQEKKRMKLLLRKKLGDTKSNDDYIDSALSLTSLRKEEVSWDYEEGERSDDEEDIFAEDGHGVDNLEDTTAGEEGDADLGQDALVGDNLTSYGQTVKHLLDKAEVEAADDELHQFESDDEEEQQEASAETDAADGSDTPKGSDLGIPSDGVTQSISSCQSVTQQPISASSLSSSSGKVDMEARIIRIMQQHMGRMTVNDFKNSFKVRQKNDEFKRIQAVIHKVCKMEIGDQKQKFIVLRPEYRR